MALLHKSVVSRDIKPKLGFSEFLAPKGRSDVVKLPTTSRSSRDMMDDAIMSLKYTSIKPRNG